MDRPLDPRLPRQRSLFPGWNNIITLADDGQYTVTPRFFALGLYGQLLFCDPANNLIIVTLGENKATEYHLLFDTLCSLLHQSSR